MDGGGDSQPGRPAGADYWGEQRHRLPCGLELARKGAHVLLACRDKARGDAALARLRAEVPAASAEVVLLDLASLESVCAFAAAELALGKPLDLLINNAGVMAPKQRLQTADGFEIQFGTNVLGHFVLTAVLLPALVRAAVGQPQRPRVVTIASIAHKQGRMNFDDLQSAKSYGPMVAYRQSKLADLMLAFELDRRLRAAGPPISDVMSVAAHPGVANTNLFQVGEFSAGEAGEAGVWRGDRRVAELGGQGAVPTLSRRLRRMWRTAGITGRRACWRCAEAMWGWPRWRRRRSIKQLQRGYGASASG